MIRLFGHLVRVLVVLASSLGIPAFAQGAVSEYALKSALLFKLPQFVYRPDAVRTTSLGICVLGNSPFGGALRFSWS